VIWNLPIDPDTITAITARAQQLYDQGKEISAPIFVNTETQETVNRFWIDTVTAEEWIAYVLTYNPVSATILS
jgi:hypothetical protein